MTQASGKPLLRTIARRGARGALWLLVVAMVAAVAMAIGLAIFGSGLHVSLGDHAMPVHQMDAIDWLLTLGALVLAMLIVFTVVPMALAFAGVVTLFALAWAGAPVIFVALLALWALRRRRAARAAPGAAA